MTGAMATGTTVNIFGWQFVSAGSLGNATRWTKLTPYAH